MHHPDRKPLYRHVGVALLRAAAAPQVDAPEVWPDLTDTEACRKWLDLMWSRSDFANAVRHASPSLANRSDAIRAGRNVGDKQIRRAAAATARYLLRATGRPTPFGLFAGVAPVALGRTALTRWGDGHRPVVRVNTEWLADTTDRLEACPELLERLDVVFSDLAIRRGNRLEVPQGPNRASIRYTSAVHAVTDAAAVPVRFGVLADKLTEVFTDVGQATVRAMLTELVQQEFLITTLRAPLTDTDPLAHLVDRLHEAGAETLPSAASLLGDLEAVRAEVQHHNNGMVTRAAQDHAREMLTARMRNVSRAGRTPLAVDLLLDCAVQVPYHVVHEMEWAASALLRLTRRPVGEPAWRDYHAAFCNRYGTGTLVAVADVLDPDAGLGYPSGFLGGALPSAAEGPSERDERLLALAWQAMAEGSGEVVLTDESILALTDDDRFDQRYIPPHVELAGRIQASSAQALERGDYTLTVAPARAAGTLTSRFTPMATGSGLQEAYRALPAATEGALQVQMSFPPAYPHAENICRIPQYLPPLLPLGEHRGLGDGNIVALNDLAITATRDRLHLVSISRRRVIEPQVFHALALNKQPPSIARFLANLSRAFSAIWSQFGWGPYTGHLPYLPRVRYRRTILSLARWRLTKDYLPSGEAGQAERRQALDRWRQRWHCPDLVELRDADRTLRLNLDEPAHVTLLLAHLSRHEHAILTETTTAAEFGWLDGHAHEIALPLARTHAAAPSPLRGALPRVNNSTHGHLPGSGEVTWLNAKIYTHPERQDEIIAERLPVVLATLDTKWCWFVRYHSRHETDHLRLRIRTQSSESYAACSAVVGEWVQQLRQAGIAGRLVFDTYYPEVGRYGNAAAMDAAEAAFVADSLAVSAGLRNLPTTVHPSALVVANMVHIVSSFLGDLTESMSWLAAQPAPTAPATARAVTGQAIQLAQRNGLSDVPGWSGEVEEAWQARATALASYRTQLPLDADTDTILESLLHMHHNRAIGIDPDSERACRRLVRRAALAWRAREREYGQ